MVFAKVFVKVLALYNIYIYNYIYIGVLLYKEFIEYMNNYIHIRREKYRDIEVKKFKDIKI